NYATRIKVKVEEKVVLFLGFISTRREFIDIRQLYTFNLTFTKMISIDEFESFAQTRLPKYVYEYYRNGADEENTLKENREAFKRLYLRPRMLRNVSQCDLGTTVQGQAINFPIGIAPTAMQCMAHADGEKATARAAAKLGTVMILSTLATTSLEEIARTEPENSTHWFQLYIYKDRKITEEILLRAEKSGFKAVVITVDAPFANFDNNYKGSSSELAKSKSGSGINKYVTTMFDPTISWSDVTWVKNKTSLPVIVKGVLTAEDAVLAQNHGANGIIVSNHGGRQLDGVPASIEVLPEIVKAVGNKCEIYMDGGVRTGTDVLKALALGARAVFVGRPVIWGLACKVIKYRNYN
uniref:(S)-2-hydroxy-acid oxidase n=1 Tax=Strigamia maritima TaxID=126957 RepID=T1IIF9_STRMM